MGPCTASSCCCQARNLPWAPVPTPHAAARPVNLSWAPVPPPHAAARSRVCHGSMYGLPLLLSPSPHTLPCATFRSPHTAGAFHFVIGCWQITGASHCCCQARNLPWAPVPTLMMLLPGP
ncbi:unnamed protein product [Staurois parvus]|uniref:Uncharacterized protein n=1 Tax=Staurois parvus TaxID=386267 RepID=A0ABN9DS86_9NEOB|nr:unnamed protein product [Staurois parvus]